MKNLIAAVLIGGLTIMNIAGVKISKILNNIMTISKLVPLCVFIAVGLFFVNGSNFTPFVPTHMADGAFANAAITMFLRTRDLKPLRLPPKTSRILKRICLGVSS